MDGIIVRPALVADAASVGQLWEKLVNHHQSLNHNLPRAAPDGARLYARHMANRLHDRYTRVLVAEYKGEVIGYVLGVVVDLVPEMFEQESGGFLADIYVDAPYRGQGIGRALVNALVDWFKEHNLNHFEWHVASSNSEGIAFWKAMQGQELMIRMRADISRDDHDDRTALSDR